MSKIIQRIKQYADSKHISIREIEKKIGSSNGVISNAIKNDTDIQSKWISIIIDVYVDINVIWLITGVGDMLKSESSAAQSGSPNMEIEMLRKQVLSLEKDKEFLQEMLKNK